MKIITNTGREYQAVWCGISTLDRALRFEIRYRGIASAVDVFSDSNETSVIKCIVDEMSQPQFYEGYTELSSVNKATNDTIVIALQKP